MIGDCVTITRGLLEGTHWEIVDIDDNGRYTLYDTDWTVTNVPEDALKPSKKCKQDWMK